MNSFSCDDDPEIFPQDSRPNFNEDKATLEECMTSRKMPFLQTAIHNNPIGGSVDRKPGDAGAVPVVIWKPTPMVTCDAQIHRHRRCQGNGVKRDWIFHANDKGRPEDLVVRMGKKEHGKGGTT